MLLAEVLQIVEHFLRSRGEHFAGNLAVSQKHDAIGITGSNCIVSHHHNGLPKVAHCATHEGEHLLTSLGVEVAGGLVGKNNVGLAGQRSGDGHTLLLPTRKFTGAVLQAIT